MVIKAYLKKQHTRQFTSRVQVFYEAGNYEHGVYARKLKRDLSGKRKQKAHWAGLAVSRIIESAV